MFSFNLLIGNTLFIFESVPIPTSYQAATVTSARSAVKTLYKHLTISNLPQPVHNRRCQQWDHQLVVAGEVEALAAFQSRAVHHVGEKGFSILLHSSRPKRHPECGIIHIKNRWAQVVFLIIIDHFLQPASHPVSHFVIFEHL